VSYNIHPKSAVSKDREYFESRRGECPDSPTGGHGWFIEYVEGGRGEMIGTCRYCNKRKLYKQDKGKWVVEYLNANNY